MFSFLCTLEHETLRTCLYNFFPDVLRSSTPLSMAMSLIGHLRDGPHLSIRHPSSASLLKGLLNQEKNLRYINRRSICG